MDALFAFLKTLATTRLPQLIVRGVSFVMLWIASQLHSAPPTEAMISGVSDWITVTVVAGLGILFDLVSHSLQKKKAE